MNNTDNANPAFGPATGSACLHYPEPKLGYTQWMFDASKRRAAGQKQRWCAGCGQFVWDEYWPNDQAHAPATKNL
jgi:hypothetical protein